MQNTRGSGHHKAVLLGATAKSKGNKKRSSFAAQEQRSSGLSNGRRTSVPDGWESMGCNIRMDATRAHYQKTEVTMPQIHQGIANASLPIPLNTIMKTWDNVPKLYQYQPSQLQVVYHRRTGETETEDLVKPEPVKPPEYQNDQFITQVLEAHHHIVRQSLPASSSRFPNTVPLPDFPRISATTILVDAPQLPENTQIKATYFDNSTVTRRNEARHLSSNQQEDVQIFPTPDLKVATVQSRTENKLVSTSCQATTKNNPVECQTEQVSLKTTTLGFNSCETQTFPSDAIMLKDINLNQHQYISRSSQTEPLKWSNVSSQTTSILTQTEHTFQSDINRNQSINKAVETEVISFNIAEIQVDLKVDSIDFSTQTEIDIDTPKICLTCDFKQLQIEEIEENMAELQDRFKTMEMELLTTKGESVPFVHKNTSCQCNDASSNTEELPPTPLENHTDILHSQLEQENEQLKVTIQTLKSQLSSFQCGLKRLRTAIEKPIVEDTNVSEDTIQEVLHKADNFILNCSNSQNRALKINDHLSILNTCVSVANGILNETPPKKC